MLSHGSDEPAVLLNGLRDYGLPDSDWPAITYAPMAGLPPVEVPAWSGCLGLEPTVEMYVGHLVHVFRLVWRVLREDATLFLNLGDSYSRSGTGNVPDSKYLANDFPDHCKNGSSDGAVGRANRPGSRSSSIGSKQLLLIPHRVALALQADAWILRQDNVWAKGLSFCEHYAGSVMPESVKDRTTRAHEYVFMLSKRPKYYYDAIAVKERAAPSTVERAHLGKCAISEGQKALVNGGMHGATDSLRDYSRSTRNLRSVWAISPKAEPRSHFAAFPSTLVAPMIKAGTAPAVCAACGAPRVRVVEAFRGGPSTRRERLDAGTRLYKGQSDLDPTGTGGTPTGTTGGSDTRGLPSVRTETLGWRAACDCDAPDERAVILDPFGGTGTVAETAKRLGRCSISVELSPAYAAMIRQSTNQRELF